MNSIQYTVARIDGDYAVLISADGTKNRVARMMLPEEIEEGNRLIYEDFEYRIIPT